MASLFTKQKRIILIRRISNFWAEFKTKKIGIAGLALLIFFVSMAIFAPWLTPYDPTKSERVAQSFAMPEWVTMFPQFRDLPKTQKINVDWKVEVGTEFVKSWGRSVEIIYKTEEDLKSTTIKLTKEFTYLQKPPNEFFIEFQWAATKVQDTQYSLRLSIITPEGKQFSGYWEQKDTQELQSETVHQDSIDPPVLRRLGYPTQENLANIIFSQTGEYTLLMEIKLAPLSKNALTEIRIEKTMIVLLGQVHGVLGTDYAGVDIFTQLVYGARISLLIGVLAAVVGTSIGVLVGVASGYLGGTIDEISMRIVDILICLPVLPLLLALVFLYGKNIFYIVLFIALFGWQGLARVVRSQTLSIKENAYIETAKASGGSGVYIMIKHIVPNVLPVAFASLVLAVPGAILFEAALSFLGFGDPRVPTWGKMLQYSFGFGGFTSLAWWWIIPPGLAIIGLCLGFVFVGYAFDEIVNPRLRRRR
jgi:ABC-type dipeptide/oligopeptide/nickel transport system permease subunit